MNEIHYIIGDATLPQGEGNKLISHICNDKNRWGLGFVVALSRRWKQPEFAYRAKKEYVLGTVDFIYVEKDIIVANMVAQHDTQYIDNIPPIRYEALRECLKHVNAVAVTNDCTIHMPRIGCGLGGGRWEEILKIIKETVTVDVYVYDLKII